MSKKFDSVIASKMGDFVRSPLGVRDTGGIRRAVYSSTFATLAGDFPPNDAKLFRLTLDDLSIVELAARPPWYPAPDPDFGQAWSGDVVSGDANTVWYSAIHLPSLFNPILSARRFVIDIYRMNGDLEPVNSWRWHQPTFGGGAIYRVVPFGTSDVLWGLGFVQDVPQPTTSVALEAYLLELDPDTMEIRRASDNLWAGLNESERLLQPFESSGGGTSSAIWLARHFRPDTGSIRVSQIMKFDPDTFDLVSIVDGPRSRLPLGERRFIRGIGGDSQSIWLVSRSDAFDVIPGTPGQRFSLVSELPASFSASDRTIIQDEVLSVGLIAQDIG